MFSTDYDDVLVTRTENSNSNTRESPRTTVFESGEQLEKADVKNAIRSNFEYSGTKIQHVFENILHIKGFID